MKCPVCSEDMECRTPIIKKVLADYHCFNEKCDSVKTNYRPHIGVVLSKGGKVPSRCISYHLPFKETYEDNWFIMEGSEVNKETTLFERNSFLMSDKKFEDDTHKAGQEKIEMIWDMGMIVSVNKFLRFPIGEFTHLKAKDVYRILTALEIYQDYSYNYNNSSYGNGYYGSHNSNNYGYPTSYQHNSSSTPDVPSVTPQNLGQIADLADAYFGLWE